MKKILITASVWMFPLVTLAACTPTDFNSLVGCMNGYLEKVIPLLVGLAVVGFLYGVLRYIYSGGDEEKRKEGVRFMTYGLVGLAVISTLWALVSVISMTFVGKAPIIPQITP